MARARKFKPSIFTDERLSGDGPEKTLLFFGLLCFSSKWGRLIDDPVRIHQEVFPFRSQVDVAGLLEKLCADGVLERIEEDGICLIQIVNIEQYCEIKSDAVDHAAEARRRARKRNAMPQWADRQAITQVYREAKQRIKDTGEQWHVDHIVPLAGKNVCGLHVHWNLQVIPARENMSKSNKFREEE
jgi:hypothetical protein